MPNMSPCWSERGDNTLERMVCRKMKCGKVNRGKSKGNCAEGARRMFLTRWPLIKAGVADIDGGRTSHVFAKTQTSLPEAGPTQFHAQRNYMENRINTQVKAWKEKNPLTYA